MQAPQLDCVAQESGEFAQEHLTVTFRSWRANFSTRSSLIWMA